MVKRYLDFLDELVELSNEDSVIGNEIAELLPNHAENVKIRRLYADLSKFHSVSLLLQKKNGINLSDVRLLFDGLISDFGESIA